MSVRQGGAWFVVQALDPDVASQGESVGTALANPREGLKVNFKPPVPTSPTLR